VKLDPRFATYSGEYAIIDTDGFDDRRSKIDRSVIETKFLGLHKRVDEVFRAIVTEHAVSLWS
jgi:uncharacterized protein (TIGR04255 family)